MIAFESVRELFETPFLQLVARASQLHSQNHGYDSIQQCILLSIKTGGCPEDCAYCPQSAHYKTDVVRTDLVSLAELTAAATDAREQGATRFCMGAAWRDAPEGQPFERVLE